MYLNTTEIKSLLKKWHYYKTFTLNSEENELSKKICSIENAINALDNVSQSIIRMKYFEGYEMESIAELVYMSRSGTYYRLNSACKEMAYIINNTA